MLKLMDLHLINYTIVVPRSDNTVTKKEDSLVKFALFDFVISTNDSCDIPESFTTVDTTSAFSMFPTSLFYQ